MITRIDQTINFGKYSGQLVSDILINDPSYVGWLCYATDKIQFSDEIYHQIFSLIKLHAKNFFAQDQLIKFLEENPNDKIAIIITHYFNEVSDEIYNKIEISLRTKHKLLIL